MILLVEGGLFYGLVQASSRYLRWEASTHAMFNKLINGLLGLVSADEGYMKPASLVNTFFGAFSVIFAVSHNVPLLCWGESEETNVVIGDVSFVDASPASQEG